MNISPSQNAFVLYKKQPAIITEISQKITISFKDAPSKQVREKDIHVLHPGPCHNLNELQILEANDMADVLAIIQEQENASWQDWCELLFDEYSPSAIWSFFQLIEAKEYLKGSLDYIIVIGDEEREQQKILKEKNAQNAIEWESFIQGLKENTWEQHNRFRFQELENFAMGKSKKSAILESLNQRQIPKLAYQLLLQWEVWDITSNPYLRASTLNEMPTKINDLQLAHEERLDLTHLNSYAIDDEFTKDPDDAISLDGDTLWIHIADVAALAPLNSPLNELAQNRISSIYLPEKTIPMLPPEVTDILGLGIQEISPALSFAIKQDDKGDIAEVNIRKTLIKATRLTYESACNDFENYPDLQKIYEKTQLFSAFRKESGAISIQLPELKLKISEDQKVTVAEIKPLFTRKLVEETMLLAGYGAALFAKQNQILIPFVTQPTPQIPFEITSNLSSQYAARRYFKRSSMSMVRGPHGGLGLPFYTRVTSPLRRYCDLLIMQQLRLFLNKETLLNSDEMINKMALYDAFIGEIIHLQRNSEKHWKLIYLLQKGEGAHFPATLVQHENNNAIFYINEIGLETNLLLKQKLKLDKQYILELEEVVINSQECLFNFIEEA